MTNRGQCTEFLLSDVLLAVRGINYPLTTAEHKVIDKYSMCRQIADLFHKGERGSALK
jgi:hypothetical protein